MCISSYKTYTKQSNAISMSTCDSTKIIPYLNPNPKPILNPNNNLNDNWCNAIGSGEYMSQDNGKIGVWTKLDVGKPKDWLTNYDQITKIWMESMKKLAKF